MKGATVKKTKISSLKPEIIKQVKASNEIKCMISVTMKVHYKTVERWISGGSMKLLQFPCLEIIAKYTKTPISNLIETKSNN